MAEFKGVAPDYLGFDDTKRRWDSRIEAGKTDQENFEAVSTIYKKEGGAGEPDFKISQFEGKRLILKDSSYKLPAESMLRTDNFWYVLRIVS